MDLVGLCGSLRARSSNRALLRAYGRSLPDGAALDLYERLGLLPAFNPDCDTQPLAREVSAFRERVNRADALVLSTPEYAHGLPGSFKNALDWLVGDPLFAGKPVAILHLSRGSTWALDSLREILRTMSADVVEAAGVRLSLGSNTLEEGAILAQGEWGRSLARSASSLVSHIRDANR